MKALQGLGDASFWEAFRRGRPDHAQGPIGRSSQGSPGRMPMYRDSGLLLVRSRRDSRGSGFRGSRMLPKALGDYQPPQELG